MMLNGNVGGGGGSSGTHDDSHSPRSSPSSGVDMGASPLDCRGAQLGVGGVANLGALGHFDGLKRESAVATPSLLGTLPPASLMGGGLIDKSHASALMTGGGGGVGGGGGSSGGGGGGGVGGSGAQLTSMFDGASAEAAMQMAAANPFYSSVSNLSAIGDQQKQSVFSMHPPRCTAIQ